jgi:hypothetical protein
MRGIALAFAATLLACGADSVAVPAPTLPGVYALESVNGKTLPYLSQQTTSSKTELITDDLIVLDNGTWSELSTFQITAGESVNRAQGAATGTYATVDGKTRFTFSDGGRGSFGVTWDGTTLALQPTGDTLIYKRAHQ